MASLFSRIIAGELPGEFIFRDALWTSFLDIRPTSFGHALLVPRQEAAFLANLAPDVLSELGGYCARLSLAVKRATGAPAVNVVINDGPEAGQVVPHVHLHVIPRMAGDNRPPFSAHLTYAEGALAAMGAKLRASWGS
jgi:histidine triad (HIT) family protein